MARWFATRGHRVSLVTWDEGQPDGSRIDGVQVLKLCRRNDGIPGLRFFHPRWTSLNSALRRADADIYYQNCGEYVTGQVSAWCRRQGKKFVYSAAADADCDVRLLLMTKRRERVLYRFGVRHADQIIVQTRAQQRMLRQGFGRESVVIPMPCPGPDDTGPAPQQPPRSASDRVLWVGRICQEKRPDRFLDLADACPDLQFDLVGPGEESAYSKGVIERAKHTRNVSVHGGRTWDQMPFFYRQAVCLCCTSDNEGFPNTFLEAWSHGLPVVSTIDPDGLIAARGLGTAVGADTAGIARALRTYFASIELRQTASTNARRYYLENHAVDRVMPRFEQSFLEILGERGATLA